VEGDEEQSELDEDEKETQESRREAGEDEEVVSRIAPAGEGECDNDIKQDNGAWMLNATMLDS
jgi:hypothetical protein